MREAPAHQRDRVVAVAKHTICLDAEPLGPGDADKIRWKTGAGNLPIALERYADAAVSRQRETDTHQSTYDEAIRRQRLAKLIASPGFEAIITMKSQK